LLRENEDTTILQTQNMFRPAVSWF